MRRHGATTYRRASPGIPKRRKNSRKPGGMYSSLLRPLVCAPPSILTRTEITAGFTFSTMSAKPTGACSLCACSLKVLRNRGRIAARQIETRGDDECGRAETGDGGGEEDDAARGRMRRFCGGVLGAGMTLDFIGKSPSGSRKRECAPFQRSRWSDAPYSVLSRGLIIGKVGRRMAFRYQSINQ